MSKTITSPGLGAWNMPIVESGIFRPGFENPTVFYFMRTHLLNGPILSGNPTAITRAGLALDSLYANPGTNVVVTDAQHAVLVQLVRSLPGWARYGSVAYAILEAE